MPSWDLIFRSDDEEAKLRVRWIEAALSRDPHVRLVEEFGIPQPNMRHLRVWFVEGCTAPKNRTLQHLNQVHGEAVQTLQSPTGLDLVLSDDFDL